MNEELCMLKLFLWPQNCSHNLDLSAIHHNFPNFETLVLELCCRKVLQHFYNNYGHWTQFWQHKNCYNEAELQVQSWLHAFLKFYRNAAALFGYQDPSLSDLTYLRHPFLTWGSGFELSLLAADSFSQFCCSVLIFKDFLEEEAFLYALRGMWEVLVAKLDFLPFLCHICIFWMQVRENKQTLCLE